jgi:putative glutamine amidotransferase
MPKPIIGITTYGRDENNRFALPGESAIDELLPLLDGVILSGGGDIDPQLYNGKTHETVYMVDSERDSSEINLARVVISEDFPVLGICRGTQVLNVALGGTLITHLPDIVGEDILHRAPPRQPIPHEVSLDPTSKLAGIIGQTQAVPMSWHHQAILQPAEGLRVVAQAPDGTIEAVEMPSHPWLIAVQWHPELTAADDPTQQRLFDEFVEAARQRQQERQKG